MRYPWLSLLVAAACVCSVPAQQTPVPTRAVKRSSGEAAAAFEVAVIKLSRSASAGGGFDAEGTRFHIWNETIARMISFAYSIHPKQIVSADDSLFGTRYDIVGIADTDGEPNLRQQQEMIQKLLADRYHLRFHREKREMPVYAIRVAKGGPRLKPTIDAEARPDWAIDSKGAARTYAYTNASIAIFMMGEQSGVDRPMVDRTGLTGSYDFYLRYNPDELNAGEASSAPGFFTAVQEQLGLKFEATRALAEVFVIDHVEKPAEN